MRLSIRLKAKIHHACITDKNPDYIGSIQIGKQLMAELGIVNGEQVHVWGVTAAKLGFICYPPRIITYAFEGPENKITINGGGAHYFDNGHKLIIAAFDLSDEPIVPKMVRLNDNNEIVEYLTFADEQ